MLFAAGAAVGWYGGIAREARACSRWPQTEGRVVTSGSAVMGRDKNRNFYAPGLTDTFLVAGRDLNGTRVTLLQRNYPSLPAVEAILTHYPAGGPVTFFLRSGGGESFGAFDHHQR